MTEKKKHPMTDAEYSERRAKLIPKALRFADAEAGWQPKISKAVKEDPVKYKLHLGWLQAWGDRWNTLFHAEMDRLARRAGLVTTPTRAEFEAIMEIRRAVNAAMAKAK